MTSSHSLPAPCQWFPRLASALDPMLRCMSLFLLIPDPGESRESKVYDPTDDACQGPFFRG